MINWDYAPHPEQKIDYYLMYGCSEAELDLKAKKYVDILKKCDIISPNVNYILYYSGIFIDANEGWGSQTEPEPPAWEPWEIEELIARPVMKCWGRGLKNV